MSTRGLVAESIPKESDGMKMMEDMDMEDIIWSTWSVEGFKIKTTKRHMVNPSDESLTLCGVLIPAEVFGVEYEEANFRDAHCKRCRKVADRIYAEEEEEARSSNKETAV